MQKIHPTADVQTTRIGKDTVVWQYSIILSNAVIGKNCNINCHVFIENDVIVGDNVTIKAGVQLWDGIRVFDNVFIGPNVTFTNDHVPRSKSNPGKFPRTIIELGASIGANSTILDGITIGSFCLIGAGSVVTKSTPAHTLWYGNPAKHMGFVTAKGKILDLTMHDKYGNLYNINDEKST
jgi:UDP-2-acetamido-3-amino-2,3-dideoxy-glucuronate N-acetyltransferase